MNFDRQIYKNSELKTVNNNKCKPDHLQSTTVHPKLDLDSSETNILDIVSFAPFLMWNEHNSKYFENIGVINDNNIDDIDKTCDDDHVKLLRDAFFSSENMDIIQNMIIKNVFYKSNETLRINKIKSETLIQVMNHMYTNFCRFLAYDLKGQIRNLDNKVTDYLVPLLLKESEFYFNYLRDSDRSNLPQLERPIFITKGRKQQLPSYYK